MIIFLPTYKRTTILPVVLQSILSADTQGIDERLLILVHNNYWPAKDLVEKIVSTLSEGTLFSYMVIHRRETLVPLDGWIDAILSTAYEGETIIILGDDDLLAPWGIRNRYREINRLDADFLLSDYVERVYFYDKGRLCWPNLPRMPVSKGDEQAVDWIFSLPSHLKTPAIHNHCYRNTPYFRDALKIAFDWCESQSWVPRTYSTGLIPSYLAYTVQTAGGRVVWLPEASVIRGAVYEESIRQDYADGGTVSFYSLLTLNTFTKAPFLGDLSQYENLRHTYLKSLRAGIWETFGNPNVDFSMIGAGLKESRLSWFDLFGPELLNWRAVLRVFPLFRGWRLKKIARNGNALILTQDFLRQLQSQYASDAG